MWRLAWEGVMMDGVGMAWVVLGKRRGCGRWARLACVLPLVVLLSCSSSRGTHREQSGTTYDAIDVLVDLLEARFAEFYEAIRNGLDTECLKDLEAALTELPASEHPGDLLWDFYESRAMRPFLVHGRDISALEEALSVLASQEAHGLPHDASRLASHRAALVSWAALDAKRSEVTAFVPVEEDWRQVRATLRREGFDAERPDALDDMLLRLATVDASHPMPRLAEHLVSLDGIKRELRRLSVKTEVHVMADLLEMARAMRLSYANNAPHLDRWLPYATPRTIERARIRTFLRHQARVGVSAAMRALEPTHPQYRALMAARTRYVEVLERGGWGQLEVKVSKQIKVGGRYPEIPAIRQRLLMEGYTVEVGTDLLDASLAEAIRIYQDTHQLSSRTLIDTALLRNFNIPAEDRLAKIDVTLQRYRESRIGAYRYFIFVNLPDFHAEVWRDGVRHMRFRIVVGNNDQRKDPQTRKPVIDPESGEPVFPNRTPLLEATLRDVIYNPYWNVPQRIRIEELEPNLVDNPYWYEDNGYEEVNRDNPRLYYVRQLPSNKNALGRVKFIFPNPHDVFLHDTPAKALFRNPVRAYSHGCMRVENPLDLAEFLLQQDNQWSAQRVRAVLADTSIIEETYSLRHRVPVQVAYKNTRVDDTGHVAFLSDIYRLDQAAVAQRTAELVERYLAP